ncbi:MAG: hypothetical protein LT070_00380 [Solirubrobacteraceae bacterium]|nr:hypothetical protein [Solirubrobacteraceae bacterium]
MRQGRPAAAEIVAICDVPPPRATAELWRLALKWRPRPERVLASEMRRAGEVARGM